MTKPRKCLLLALLLGACDPSAVTPEPEPAEIRLSQPSLVLDDTASAVLAATVVDGDGNALEGASLVWSSSDTTVATVAAGGVKARRPGETEVSATLGAVRGVARVRVYPALSGLRLAADSITVGVARPSQLVARAVDLRGDSVSRPLGWTSSDSTIATVDSAGIVTGRREGVATVTARAGVTVARAAIRVAAPPVIRVEGLTADTILDTPTGRLRLYLRGEIPESKHARIVQLSVTLDGVRELLEVNNGRGVGFTFDRELAPGDHVLTFTAEDSVGQRTSFESKLRVVLASSRRYTVSFLGTAGGTDSEAVDLNAAGDIVGYSVAAGGATRAVLWRGGRAIDLGQENSKAVGINAAGRIVGTFTSTCARSFTWEDGTLSPIAGCDLTALDINDRGTILLTSWPASTQSGLVRGGVVESLPSRGPASSDAIHPVRLKNDDWVLAAQSAGGGGGSAFLYTAVLKPGGVIEYLLSQAGGRDLNDRGDLVGAFSGGSAYVPNDGRVRLASGRSQTLRWTTRAEQNGGLYAINNGGLAVGRCDACGVYLWEGGRVYRMELTSAAWEVDRVHEIDDAGRVIGHARNTATGEKGAVLLTPVP